MVWVMRSLCYPGYFVVAFGVLGFMGSSQGPDVAVTYRRSAAFLAYAGFLAYLAGVFALDLFALRSLALVVFGFGLFFAAALAGIAFHERG
jgi:hypothetical protein